MMKSIKFTQAKILLTSLFCCLLLSQGYSQGIKISEGATLKAEGLINLKTFGSAGITTDDDSYLLFIEQSSLLLDGNLDLNNATVELGRTILQGSNLQIISADSEVFIQDLTIDNNAGVTLQTPVFVRGALNLIDGKINTTEQNLVTLASRLTFNTGSSASYINGFVAIRTRAVSGGSYDFTFPVGTSSGYFPVRLKFKQNNGSSTTTYQASVVGSNPPDYQLAGNIKNLSTLRYWNVDNGNTANFSEAEITLPITTAEGIAASDAIVAKASDETWENIGAKNVEIPGTVTSSTPINSLGIFAIGSRQVAPSFTLSAANVTDDEDFEGIKIVTISPAANTPAADYSFSPPLSTISFADISYDVANREVNISSLPNEFGTLDITATATDKTNDNNTFSSSFSITINPVNDAPTIVKPLPNIEVGENDGPITINIEDVFSDVEDASLSYDVASEDESLFTAVLNNSSTEMVLSFEPDREGSANLILGAEDSGGKRTEQTIIVTLLPPDAPTFTLSTAEVNEVEDFEETRSVTISPDEGTPASGYSFNPELTSIEVADVSYNEETKTLSVSSVENAFGFVNLEITATDQADNQNSFTSTLVITIDPVNDSPVLLDTLLDFDFVQNAESQLIDISNVFADPDEDRLSYSIENSNEDLLSVTVNGQQLILNFAVDLAGEAIVVLTAQDGEGGLVSDQFSVTVVEQASNMPPVADAGPDQIVIDQDEDGIASITLDGSNSIDPDGEIVSYIWTKDDGATVANGVNPSIELEIGDFKIALIVEDNLGSVARDTLALSIRSTSDGNDAIPPSLPIINIPNNFAIDGAEDLIFSIDAIDESGIATSQFGIRGLSSEEEVVLTDITGDGSSFQVAQPVSDLLTIDPLGIEYTFFFEDAAGNSTTHTGYVYWTYEATTFSGSDLNWRELGNRTEYFENDFNIVALPFDAQRVNTILSGLGAAADTAWRLFSHEAGTNNFTEYGKSSFGLNSNFEPGKGYFLILRNVGDIEFGGQTAEMSLFGDQLAHEITLKEGWNLIGNPFPYDVDWQLVEAHPLNENVTFVQPLQRLLGGSTNRDYVANSPQLKAFEGAFLFWDGNGSDKLYITPSVRLDTQARYDAISITKGWELPLTIEKGEWRTDRAGVGMRPGAKESLDYNDAIRVPKLQNRAELIFKQSNYDLNRSVVPELNSYRWKAEIANLKANEEVILRWNRATVSDLNQELYLWDASASRLIDMSITTSYRLTATTENNPQIQVYFGSKEAFFDNLEVDVLKLGKPYPNPTSQLLYLPLSLPDGIDSHDVYLSLYNSRGQKVKNQNFGKLKSGYHELKLELVEGLNAGLYHFKLSVSGTYSKLYNGRFIVE